MSKKMITAIVPKSNYVEVNLACGHTMQWFPFSGQTPQQLAEYMQTSIHKPVVSGKTKLKCEICTTQEQAQ